MPRTATLEQVLRALVIVATSPAFATEMTVAKAALNPGPVTFGIRDANGSLATYDVADTALPDTNWLHTAHTRAEITDALRLTPPFPHLLVMGLPSVMQTITHGEVFRDIDFQGQSYRVDAITFCGQDEPQLAQREALIMARAFERLIRRNEQLGGLVELIQPIAPIEPGGTGPAKNGGIVGAARQRYEVLVLAV